MGCTKCGTDLSSLYLIVKDIIRQLIDDGKLQEGLVDCTDKRLWRDSRVLTCDLLGDAVCQLITNGDICLVKPEALTVEKQENGSHKISLLMSDGTVLDTTARLTDGVLNSVTYDAKTKIAKFTTTNGDSYEIELDIPEPVEYTFTTKDNGDIEVANGKKEVLATIPTIKVKAVKKENGTVVITNQDGTTVEIEKQAGLDCAAIDALPEKPWKKGTVIVAKQDGECVRLTALDSIFQEVGVGITADKTNAFINEEYKVVVTVSNTGEGKNELTNLNIVGPANTEDYEIKDVSFTKSEADEVEQVNDLTYNIRGLKKGGVVKVKYTVVPKVLGNYQFTAAVNPNSALDKDLGNNNATLILNARTKADPTYVPSVDCPLITATELDSNTVLQQLSPDYKTDINGKNLDVASVAADKRTNIFSQRRTLKGLRIKLDGASTVVGYKKTYGDGNNGVPVGDGTTDSHIIKGDANSYFFFDANSERSGTDGYSFSDGVLEITEDLPFFAFACRPQGTSCRWQLYAVFSTVLNRRREINATNIIGATVTKDATFNNSFSRDKNSSLPLIVPPSDKELLRSDLVVYGVSERSPAYLVDKLIVTVHAGTAASLNYTSTDNYAVTQVRGKTTITENSITVAADAKATDSVNTKYIQVIIEE